jgi:hypothetical protein
MKLPVVVVISTLLLGCNEVSTSDSDDVKTSGIDADYRVTNEGDVFTVRAELSIGDSDEPTYLVTTGGDSLEATFNGTTKTLSKTGHGHEAIFAAGDGEMTIDFVRSEFISALGSDITLSSSSNFDSPADNASLTYVSSDSLSLTYPSGLYDQLEWKITCGSGSTLETRYGSSTSSLNDGNFSIVFSELFSQGPQLTDYASGCDVAFSLSQEVSGSMSSEFNSGEFQADILSTVSVTVALP